MKCPVCEAEVTEQEKSCPDCGFAMSEYLSSIRMQNDLIAENAEKMRKGLEYGLRLQLASQDVVLPEQPQIVRYVCFVLTLWALVLISLLRMTGMPRLLLLAGAIAGTLVCAFIYLSRRRQYIQIQNNPQQYREMVAAEVLRMEEKYGK